MRGIELRNRLIEFGVDLLRRSAGSARLLPPKFALRLRLVLQQRLGVLEPEFRLLPLLTSRQRIAVDAGANAGVFSLAMSTLARAVYAYEPIPDLADGLRSAALSNVHVINAALSDQMGEQTLKIPVIRGIQRPTRASLTEARGAFVEQRVELLTLDSQGLSDVGFIKIDVEGHEYPLLLGAAQTIAQSRPNILIEVEDARLHGIRIGDVFALLRGWDYTGYFYYRRRLHRLEEFEVGRHQRGPAASTNEHFVNNFLFLPKHARVTLPETL